MQSSGQIYENEKLVGFTEGRIHYESSYICPGAILFKQQKSPQ